METSEVYEALGKQLFRLKRTEIGKAKAVRVGIPRHYFLFIQDNNNKACYGSFSGEINKEEIDLIISHYSEMDANAYVRTRPMSAPNGNSMHGAEFYRVPLQGLATFINKPY